MRGNLDAIPLRKRAEWVVFFAVVAALIGVNLAGYCVATANREVGLIDEAQRWQRSRAVSANRLDRGSHDKSS